MASWLLSVDHDRGEPQVRTGTSEPGAAVSAQGLMKSYPGVDAVRGVDLSVGTGQVFGFLGPNGAGKSTTIAMLCTLARPTAGRAVVAGFDVVTHPAQVRQRIGLVFQDLTLDTDLTAEENLRFHAELYGLPRGVTRSRIPQMLDLMGLLDRRHSVVRTFSGGMQRRLEIARGLLHAPQVLFLDEPTIGLDPQTRAQMWEHLQQLRRRQAITLFLTTHYLEEAEQCDRIAIIDHGRIIAEGTPKALKSTIGADRVQLRTTDDEKAVEALRTRFRVEPSTDADGIHFRTQDATLLVPRLCTGLDVDVLSVEMSHPSLDDVFLHYTGRTIRDSEQPPAQLRWSVSAHTARK